MSSRGHRTVAASALGLAVALSGCASIIHGTTQEVEIVTQPPDATAKVFPEGTTVVTPATVELRRKTAHTIRVELAGYCGETILVDRVASNAVNGNALFGGLIGLTVDTSNGAAYRLEPESLTLRLHPIESHDGSAGCAPAPCR